jgi:hypothetical protein
MLAGHLDAVPILGHLEGWAFDTDDAVEPFEVAVFSRSNEVAWGLAHRFCTDLMNAKYGIGWSAFRMRLFGIIGYVRDRLLRLLERTSGAQIRMASALVLIEDSECAVQPDNGAATFDPTVNNGTWHPQNCEKLFPKLISANGLETFLSAAYAYMLGRPVDAAGLIQSSQAIRKATRTPFGVLQDLEQSCGGAIGPSLHPIPIFFLLPKECVLIGTVNLDCHCLRAETKGRAHNETS